jgi:hypothetical protein
MSLGPAPDLDVPAWSRSSKAASTAEFGDGHLPLPATSPSLLVPLLILCGFCPHGVRACTNFGEIPYVASERFRNRPAVLDHALIAQIQTRHLDHERGAANTKVFARDVLRIGIHEAGARVRAAEAAGPRVALTGEVLPPIFEQVAAAQAEGTVSAGRRR